jgi:hypothetical protein
MEQFEQIINLPKWAAIEARRGTEGEATVA